MHTTTLFTKWIGIISWSLAATLFVVFQVLAQTRVVTETFPDSSRYFSPTPIWSLENAGLFYSIFVRAFDVFPGIAFAQMLFSIIAWLFLSLAVKRLFSSWIGLFCSFGVIFIASQESVTNWNNLVLSESVAISSFALWISAFLFLLKPAKTSRSLNFQMLFFLTASLLSVLNRPQIIIVVIPISILIAFSLKKRFAMGPWIAVVLSNIAIAALASIRLISLSLGSPFASAYAQHLLENRSGFAVFGLTQAGCDPASAVSGIPYGDLVNYCPNVETLVAENKLSFTSWAMSKPLDVILSFTHWLNHDAVLVNYSSSPTIIERANANTILGVGFPFATIIAFYIAVALAVTVISGLIYGFQFSVKRLALTILFVALMFGYVLLTWGVDGVEMPRHTLPILLFIPPVITAGMLYIFKQDRELIPRFARRE